MLHVDVDIKCVPVTALVDTGVQSTIISQSMLHAVNRHLGRGVANYSPVQKRCREKELGKELLITSQVPLVLSMGDKSVSVPVFVPDSEQACLLGITLLGIRVYCRVMGNLIPPAVPSQLDPVL